MTDMDNLTVNDPNNLRVQIRIQNNSENLRYALEKIAKHITKDPTLPINKTSVELAEYVGVSEPTIIRFCKALGFNGYKDFKIQLAQDLSTAANAPVPSGIEQTDSTMEVIQKVLLFEAEDIQYSMSMLDSQEFTKCLSMIDSSNRIAFFGIGSSAIVATIAKEHFLHYGKNAQSEPSSMLQLALASSLSKDDVAFAISISGESQTTIHAIQAAKELGAQTICLTQAPNSQLAKICDCSLIVYRKSKFLDDLGTISKTVNSSIIDAIAIAYASRNWNRASDSVLKTRHNYKHQEHEEY